RASARPLLRRRDLVSVLPAKRLVRDVDARRGRLVGVFRLLCLRFRGGLGRGLGGRRLDDVLRRRLLLVSVLVPVPLGLRGARLDGGLPLAVAAATRSASS